MKTYSNLSPSGLRRVPGVGPQGLRSHAYVTLWCDESEEFAALLQFYRPQAAPTTSLRIHVVVFKVHKINQKNCRKQQTLA